MSRETIFGMYGEKLKGFIRRYLFFSFNSTINAFYISIIIIFVSITGGVSYHLATKQIEENTFRNINDTVLQTNNYIEFILSDVFEQLVLLSNDLKISTLILTDNDDISPQLYIDMDEDLKAIYQRFNSIIESIYIDIDYGKASFYQGSQQLDPSFSYKNYFMDYKGSKESFYWKNIHQNNLSYDKNEVMSVFKLIGTDKSTANGIILFNLRADFFKKVFNKSLIGDNGYLTLMSADASYEAKIVEDVYQLDSNMFSQLNKSEDQSGTFSFENPQGENMNAVYNTIGVNKWKVAAVFPESQILKRINYIKYFTIIFVVLIIIMATFTVNIVGKYISKPIKKLANQMTTINQKQLQVDDGLAVPKEMKILYSSFNEQMARNKSLLDQIHLEQKEKRQLEVAVIQAQVNPHFLYNTLYSIKGLCDMGLNEDASEMVSALSSFFRISISRGNEIITIEEEITHIQSYLYIMEMRYGDDFSYSIDIEKETLSSNILKLTLQPLIENAIYHGVKQKRGHGVISVRVFQDGKNINLEVVDNGRGIEKTKLRNIINEIKSPYSEQKNQYIGIGLRSVNERVKGYFGKEYGLFIESEIDKGSKISIVIPKVKEGISEYE